MRKRVRLNGSMAHLSEGCAIFLAWDHERKGKIVRLGPEVSEVKFDDGQTRYIGNDQLERVP